MKTKAVHHYFGQVLAWPLLLAWWFAFTSQAAKAQGMQAQIPAVEYSALVDLYNSTSGASWSDNTGWLDPAAASWYGVTVAGGSVQSLYLNANQLNGAIPDSLGNLSQLQLLYLGGNQLSGTIPDSLGNLSQLTNFLISFSQLSGAIPPSLGNLSQLQFLILSGNHFSGSIPTSLGNLSQLQSLGVNNNQLSGTIPDSLGNLSQLLFLHLEENQLSGSIPDSLGNISQLEYLYLHDNQLSGIIPDSLGNPYQLHLLALYNNQLSGTIPDSLGNLSQLQNLLLYNNQLSGDVPDFSDFTSVHINICSNYLNIAAGSQSLANIDAMIAAGNTVVYTPQYVLPPATFSVGPIFVSQGTAQVGLTGAVGQTYAIQASTDLVNWTALGSVTLTNASGQYLDAFAASSQRFYRTFISP